MKENRPVDDLPPPNPRYGFRPPPLDGVRVLDFTRYLSGPWCTQTLADLGADVIKVERPGIGDETRGFTPPEICGESPYFLGLNRNKRSMTLDLRTPSGVAVARDLATASDILVENFAPGVMNRYGLGYSALKEINPSLIYCAISGWGAEGAYADQPGFDSVFQAESGFASLTGDPDRPPMRTGSPVIDIAAAMNASTAILAALAARDRPGPNQGVGQWVEVALYDTALTMTAYYGMNYLASGRSPVRQGNTAAVAAPLGLFEAADGKAIYVSCGTKRSWEDFARGVLDRPDMIVDHRFATHQDRNINKAVLMAEIGEIIAGQPRDFWMERVLRVKSPVGAVRSIAEAFQAVAAKERGMATAVPHPGGDVVPNVTSAFRFSETPVVQPVAAPALDANRDEILREVLRCDDARIAALDRTGAFGASQDKG